MFYDTGPWACSIINCKYYSSVKILTGDKRSSLFFATSVTKKKGFVPLTPVVVEMVSS
jgi:hypothetical protein